MPIDRRQASALREGFAEWAEEYDEETQGRMRWSTPAKLSAWLAPMLRHGQAVLDLGCGTGQTPRHFPGLRLKWTGVDLSREMLRIARKGRAYKAIHQMNIERKRYPFASGRFDAVTASGVFEFTDKLKQALEEIHRILKPRAPLAFSVEAPPDPQAAFDVFDSKEYYYTRYRYGLGHTKILLAQAKFEILRGQTIKAYIDDEGDTVRYNCFLARRA